MKNSLGRGALSAAASWHLLRLDVHQLAINGLPGTRSRKKA